MFATLDPERAAGTLARALEYFKEAVPLFEPGIRLLFARAEAARGREAAAEMQLEAGIRTMESQRMSLSNPTTQASFFDQAASLFDDMVGFQVDTRHDPRRALSFVERGRARQLLDALAERGNASLGGQGHARPLEPETLQRELPADVALVYYACFADRLLSWVVTRDSLRFVEHSLDEEDLRQRVASHEAAMEGRATLSAAREQAESLFDHLIRPVEPLLHDRRVLVLIPDAILQSVAFGALLDRQTGRFLVEDHLVGVAPSGSIFVRSSVATAAAGRRRAWSLLAVANPQFDRSRWPGLPSLPGAEAEAAEIARLYEHATVLAGPKATRREFLSAARNGGVVHYAGHAVQDSTVSAGRLLLAPEDGGADSGVLSLHDLKGGSFSATRAVVLAACRTGSGDASRMEGALSLARPFLAVGVPSVVASLWDVDDTTSRKFFVAFHRALLAQGDPLTALNLAQRAFLSDRDPLLSHPATWAAFVAIGGIDKGPSSRARSSAEKQRL
jgi:CHAT domain-containing protein